MRNWRIALSQTRPQGLVSSLAAVVARSNSPLVVVESKDVATVVAASSFKDERNTSGSRLARRDHFSAPPALNPTTRTGGSRVATPSDGDGECRCGVCRDGSDAKRSSKERTRGRALRSVERKRTGLRLADLLLDESLPLEGIEEEIELDDAIVQ